MKNILVPIGSSKNAVSHLQYAVDFAKAVNARLFVVQVYNVYTKAGTIIKIDAILEKESMSFLNDKIAQLDTKGVEIITRVLKGKFIDTLELACKSAEIDLVMIEPRTNSIKDGVFLGKTSGKIIKRMNVPSLIVPEGFVFKEPKTILMAVNSAIIKKVGVLNPIQNIKHTFGTIINLVLVKTPHYKEEDFNLNEELSSMTNDVTKTDGATTYQGMLKYLKLKEPDMICVVRRKRGFFAKKWEKNTILKKDFYVKIPVLVLSGLK